MPVGAPAPGDVTLIVAVIVTLCPQTLGFGVDVTAVVVLAILTVCTGVSVPLDGSKPEPPRKLATTVCVPTDNALVAVVATPLAFVVVATGAPPSITKFTVAPAPGFGETVAVNVTGCPKTDGLALEVTVVAVAAEQDPDAVMTMTPLPV